MFQFGQRRLDRPTSGAGPAVRALPIDHEHLRRYTMGDLQLELEVLELFAGELPKTIAALRAARTDLEWKFAAHTLKGSARAVGAWRIAAEAVAAEQNPLIVNDTVGKAEVVAACELASRDAIAYVATLTATG